MNRRGSWRLPTSTHPCSGRPSERVLAFLHTLTDSTFIRDPRFTNPHPQPSK